jgi:hypothetical protein
MAMNLRSDEAVSPLEAIESSNQRVPDDVSKEYDEP